MDGLKDGEIEGLTDGEILGDTEGLKDGEILADIEGLAEADTPTAPDPIQTAFDSLPELKNTPSSEATLFIKIAPFLKPVSPVGRVTPDAITILSLASLRITSLY